MAAQTLITDLENALVIAFQGLVVGNSDPRNDRDATRHEIRARAEELAEQLTNASGWEWFRSDEAEETDTPAEQAVREFIEAEWSLEFQEHQIDAFVQAVVARGWTVA
ncbi:hypothetical protein E3_1700 [Rhodococcus phage E3]|uniref:hypothetical protein n=1 Tax=Rhodococcus phage E3 TaxID=1007869 RepID=UPI0002C6D1D8|nr:hypothetical protein M176_gp179 [Rhodococcus phage E3]AEQ21087.1 hypothetical protein E3_1700 [Rhodococcus phage E3]